MILFMRMKSLLPLDTDAKQHLFWSILAVSSVAVFCTATICFGLSLALYFFSFLLIFLATIMRPEAGLYVVVIGTMWFERYFTLLPITANGVDYKLYPLDLVILFIVLSVGARLLEGRLKWKFKKIDFFLIGFGIACTYGMIIAISRHLNLALAFGTYKNYFIYGILYFLVAVILRTKDDWLKFMKALTVGGAGLFFFLFYGLIVGKGLWSEYTPLSTAGERLIAGTHIFYFVIFFFWLISWIIWPIAKEHARRKTYNIFIFIALSLIGVALVVSLVRHLWIAVAAVLLFWVLFLPTIRRRLRYLYIVVAVSAVSAILMFAYINVGKIFFKATGESFSNTSQVLSERTDVEYATSGQDASFRWRLSTWKVGLSAWMTHPFFGVGLGYEIYGLDNNWPFHIAMREIHNDYLAILYQLGAIGFLVIVEWMIYLWYQFFKNRSSMLSSDDPEESRLFFTWWSVALTLMAGFTISIYWDVNFFNIWWWIALAAVRFLWFKFSEYENPGNK